MTQQTFSEAEYTEAAADMEGAARVCERLSGTTGAAAFLLRAKQFTYAAQVVKENADLRDKRHPRPAHWREAMESYEVGSIDAIERTAVELAAKERGQ